MKFGKWLKSHKIPEWEQSYLDYDKLKKLITQLEETHLIAPQSNGGKGNHSYHLPMRPRHIIDDLTCYVMLS